MRRQTKHDSTLSFSAAFLLHASLLAALFLHYSHNKPEKISLVIDAYIIDKTNQQAQQNRKEHHKDSDNHHQEQHRDEKNGTHEAKLAAESQHSSHQHEATKAEPIYKPLPEIPQELRYEAFNCQVVARFHIKTDGSATAELAQPCENPQLNYLLLKSLKQWRFEPSSSARTSEIKVNFRVE
jgi:outer membrane biosynthesis protein TonB